MGSKEQKIGEKMEGQALPSILIKLLKLSTPCLVLLCNTLFQRVLNKLGLRWAKLSTF